MIRGHPLLLHAGSMPRIMAQPPLKHLHLHVLTWWTSSEFDQSPHRLCKAASHAVRCPQTVKLVGDR